MQQYIRIEASNTIDVDTTIIELSNYDYKIYPYFDV